MSALRPNLLVLLALAGCAPERVEFGTRAWVGEHLEVWTSEGVTVCGGSFEALDRHAAATSDYAVARGVETRTSPYRYYWVQPDELDGGPCAEGPAPGCFSPRNDAIYATRFYPHEVVHAEFASGHSSFVDEGFATLLGGSRFVDVPDTPVQTVIDQAAGVALPGEDYELAAKFVAAAEALYPEESMGQLLQTRRADDFRAMATAAEDLDLDDIVSLHDNANTCSFDAVRQAVTECTMPPVAWNGPTWTADGQVDCAASDVMGPNRDDEVWVVRSFEIEAAGEYTVRFEGDATVRLSSCENRFCESGFSFNGRGFDDPSNGLFLAAGADYPFEFAAGRHWFRVSRLLDDDAEGTYALSVSPDWPE